MGTTQGYWYTKNNLWSIYAEEVAKPIERIDVRTFDHDVQVMKSRLLLEEHEKVTDWQSDRQLKLTYLDYFKFGGSRDSAPDGVYKSLGGKVIAFEYEIAQKSKKRYWDKVRRYVECMRQSGFSDKPKYDHVRIVCEKESVRRILLDATELYRNYFTVELANDFLSISSATKINSPIHTRVH